MPRPPVPRRAAAVAALLAASLLVTPGLAQATHDQPDPVPVPPDREALNFAKQEERAPEYLTAPSLEDQATQGSDSFENGVREQTNDAGRLFLTDLCWSKVQGCGGDPRLAYWKQHGHGRVKKVRFTGRNGSTIAGRVWATRRGPDKRPLIVVTPGSVQATEEMYWWAAQTLAKSGYVVLTRDAQNQGRSDTFGEGEDILEGVPAQATGNTFFDHTRDAIDFGLSRPGKAYCPKPSRSGTSHCDKQRRRVRQGKATRHNPFWRLVDRKKVGLVGHSYGASGSSWVGQQDRRVDAVVAWDNLCNPAAPPRDVSPVRYVDSAGMSAQCASGGEGRPKPRVPSLGLSGDYFLTPTPYTTKPKRRAKSKASFAFSKAGVDTGEIVIRGGTHYEWSYIPTPTFGATLRGIDMSAWYTTAWFDRYLKGKWVAQKRLLTNRWRSDGIEASVDLAGDGNMYSWHYRSRLDIGHDGGWRVRCENLRKGCAALTRRDAHGPSYSYVSIATSKDR